MAPKLETSESVGDYLKALLDLGGPSGDLVSGTSLAERLGVRAASVTGMLQKLAAERPPLVVYEKHRGARLSPAGRQRAWSLLRRHRLLERFLQDVLHYPCDEVHEEAEHLEHFISERFEDRVAALLGDPRFDPHGHVIPPKHAPAVTVDEVALSEWPLATPAVITSVGDRDPAALRELQRLDLMPGVAVTVESRHADASTVKVSGRRPVRLAAHLAACVLVAAPMATGTRHPD